MNSAPVAHPSSPAGFRLPRRALALAFTATAAVLAVVIMASFSWPLGPKADQSRWFGAGATSGFQIDQPIHFADQGFWLVRRGETEFLALYEKDPHLGCKVPWRPDFEFTGRTGWFRNLCHAETYDLDGFCHMGPCPRGLDRFPVRIAGGEVQVDTAHVVPGPALGAEHSLAN